MYTELQLILYSWNYTQYRVLRNRLFNKCLLSQNSVLCVCNRHVNLWLANHKDYVLSIQFVTFYFFFKLFNSLSQRIVLYH